MGLLDNEFVRRVRQNHAVEHATITILMRDNPLLPVVGGRSNHRGFYVFGQLETTKLEVAAQEALKRLQDGQAELAIHPNCGTNLVTTGALAGLAALATTAITRRSTSGKASLLDQVPAAMMAATAAIIVGRPLGTRIQERVTTLAQVPNLRLGTITRRTIGRWTQHFVILEENPL